MSWAQALSLSPLLEVRPCTPVFLSPRELCLVFRLPTSLNMSLPKAQDLCGHSPFPLPLQGHMTVRVNCNSLHRLPKKYAELDKTVTHLYMLPCLQSLTTFGSSLDLGQRFLRSTEKFSLPLPLCIRFPLQSMEFPFTPAASSVLLVSSCYVSSHFLLFSLSFLKMKVKDPFTCNPQFLCEMTADKPHQVIGIPHQVIHCLFTSLLKFRFEKPFCS